MQGYFSHLSKNSYCFAMFGVMEDSSLFIPSLPTRDILSIICVNDIKMDSLFVLLLLKRCGVAQKAK